MTDEYVLTELDRLFAVIKAESGDDEAQHSAEDKMHVLALKAILDGSDCPRELAASALRANGMDFCRWCA